MIALVLLMVSADPFKEGGLKLFDGETLQGWKIDGEAKVEKGKLILGGKKATTAEVTARFGHVIIGITCQGERGVKMQIGDEVMSGAGDCLCGIGIEPGQLPLRITIPAGKKLVTDNVTALPTRMTPLFDGKSLTGWKVTKDPKREKSAFAVKDGILSMKGGPGDLQSDKKFDDFVLQLKCRTNGKHLNSGVFFRCIPGEYQNGYECQIHNDFTADPPRKYLVGKTEILSAAKDWGTGAIYRRVPARKAVAKDGEWFTLTVVARGRHLATWVDGIQQVDWTDDRKEDDNPRKGYRAKAGALSLQGHDPTTDLSFRNIRYAPIPRKP